MELLASLSELLHGLDGTTYFFVSSGLFVGIVALVFLILGLWLGGIIWGRFKRRFRASEATVESLKNESAQLKVRIADLTARLATAGASNPLTRPESSMPAELQGEAPPLDPGPPATSMQAPETALPPSQAFTLWTDPEWQGPAPAELHAPSRAFTVWTEVQTTRTTRIADFLPVVSHTLSAGAGLPASLMAKAQVLPPGAPFTVWTEAGWEPVHEGPALFPVSQAFTVWTQEEVEVPEVAPCFCPSQAFSLWTEEGVASQAAAPPLPPSAAFSVWTEPGWEPIQAALPAGRPFTLWTENDFAPAPPSAMITSHAYAHVVAEAAEAVRSIALVHGAPPPVAVPSEAAVPTPLPPSQAFTLWPAGHDLTGMGGITQRSALAALIRKRVDEGRPSGAPSGTPAPAAPPQLLAASTEVPAPAAPQSPPPVPAVVRFPAADPVMIEPLPFVDLEGADHGR